MSHWKCNVDFQNFSLSVWTLVCANIYLIQQALKKECVCSQAIIIQKGLTWMLCHVTFSELHSGLETADHTECHFINSPFCTHIDLLTSATVTYTMSLFQERNLFCNVEVSHVMEVLWAGLLAPILTMERDPRLSLSHTHTGLSAWHSEVKRGTVEVDWCCFTTHRKWAAWAGMTLCIYTVFSETEHTEVSF